MITIAADTSKDLGYVLNALARIQAFGRHFMPRQV